MKKVFKWTLRVSLTLIGIVLIAALILLFVGSSRLNTAWDIEADNVSVVETDDAIERGRHLVEAMMLCRGCHGEDLSGRIIFDQQPIASFAGSNLTRGEGGIGSVYNNEDLARAIRHGVNRDGRGLLIMHSDAYNNLGREDLAAVIAYVKSVPPVDNHVEPTRIGLLGKLFVGLGMFDADNIPLIPAEIIDHSREIGPTPQIQVSPEYGRYVIQISVCKMCHGDELTGGPPIEPGAPAGPNLTVYGPDKAWTEQQFIHVMRTGQAPHGRTINSEYMPWERYRHMTDDELKAIYAAISEMSASVEDR